MRSVTFLTAAFFILLSCFAPTAHAEDGPRFRGGVAVQIPGVVYPERAYFTAGLGVRGDLGVQIDDAWAVYAAPEAEFIAPFGVAAGLSLMGEHTWGHVFSAGIGPALYGVLDYAYAGSRVQPGANLRLAVHPVHEVRREGDAAHARRRTALTIFVEGRAGASFYGSGAEPVIMPVLGVGYSAY